MGLAELADLAKLTISKSPELVQTDGLWTSRNPVLLPPEPIPGQRNARVSTRPSYPIFPRAEFGLCTNQSGDVYFYGGTTRGRTDELYRYSMKDNAVTLVQCWGDRPGSRNCHAMTLVGNVIAVHGGWSTGDDPNLYLLNLVSHEWSKITVSGDSPGNLRWHAMAAVGTTIYIFGGNGPAAPSSNKLWAFDLDKVQTKNPSWELVKPSSQERPNARFAATLVSYHNQLILFAGTGNLFDVWSFDPQSRRWSELQCTGDIPPSRVAHTATILDDIMYIIGGSQLLSSLHGDHMKDIFALKIPEKRWVKWRNPETLPVARYYHASAGIGTKIFIFGGDLGGKSEEHSIHILDTEYIDNNLHTPERLNKPDAKLEAVPIRDKEESSKGSKHEYETESLKRGQIVSHILDNSLKTDLLAQLQRTDAQMIVDFLADELGRQDILQSNTDKRHILHLLTKLAKSTQIFPKSTELSDVQCNLTSPVNDEGGYGFIYKGVFKNQVICVKAVRVIGSSTKAAKMLRAQAGETVLLAHVSHPNVIPLYGTYLSSEESPRICIVSPWMENGDLVAYLRKFPNTPKIPLASDMAAGLTFLHDMGIIHADLKARNVLVSRSQRAMLADFGIATVLHTNVGTTTAGDFSGTTYWMAPELLIAVAKRQPPPPTKESDVWGFACVCYEMFTGEIPFVDRDYSPIQLILAFMGGRRITPLRPNEEGNPINADGELMSADDQPWVPLAERCWNYDPSERPTAAQALQSLTEMSVQDDRPSMDEELATFKAIKDSRVKVEIDYSHILSIIRNT